MSHQNGLRHHKAFQAGDVQALVSALSDENLSIDDRHRVVRYLGDMPSEDSSAALARVLDQDPDEKPRIAAARALGKFPASAAAQALTAATTDGSPRVRCWAIDSLGKLKVEHSAAAVVARLADDDKDVRAYAARVVGELGSSAGCAELAAVAKGSERLAASNAVESLIALRCRPEVEDVAEHAAKRSVRRTARSALEGL